jgi:hypothetical protein
MTTSTPKKGTVPAKNWQARFLTALCTCPNVSAACATAGVSRNYAYEQRKIDATFAEAWEDALTAAVDNLEGVGFARAVSGSDTLLIFLLKAHRPAVYRETVNVRLIIQQEAARLAAATGQAEADILAEFNALIGANA